MNNPAEQFRDTVQAAGITPPDVIEAGKFYRFPGEGKNGSNTSGWCKLFDDGQGGVFGDYSTGLSTNWQATLSTPLTATEREAFRRSIAKAKKQAEADRNERYAEAQSRAAEIWDGAALATAEHPYLAAKGVAPHGLRLHAKGALIAPLYYEDVLHSLQFIGATDKRFLKDGRTAGCYYPIGRPDGVLCIVEGFATGATINEATGYAVAVAFNAGNLEAVASAMRTKFPDLILIICADDDYQTGGNPGLTKATAATREVGGLLALPVFDADRPAKATDFNDMASAYGLGAVKKAIAGIVDKGDAMTPAAQPNASTGLASGAYFEAMTTCAADIVPEPISWLWNGWLAAGKLHILAGAPGTGKTTLSLSLAATLTTAGRWPDGTPCTQPGNVLIWSGEDDPADTLVPRLDASGANLNRVHFLTGTRDTATGEILSFDPSRDIPAIEVLAKRIGGVSMLIIDPIVSATGGADSHKNAEVRRALQPVVDIGRLLGCCIVGISHFSKGTQGRDPTERVTGSLAFGALARVVLAAAKLSEDDGGGRLLCRTKSNIGADHGGVKYDLLEKETSGGIFASYAAWGECVEGAARELLAQADTQADDESHSERKDAKRFLLDLLSDGAVSAKQVSADCEGAGHAKRTIDRAAKELGILREKSGMKGGWVWRLAPEGCQHHPEECEERHTIVCGNLPESWHSSSKADDIIEVEL
jgi:putative DNA primase/helicase